MQESKKQTLIRIAQTLFYEHGYHATGVDMIINVAGIAKPTMYRYFSSKEALFHASLRLSTEQAMDWLASKISKRKTPRGQLLAIFDAYLELCKQPEFSGCRFVKATLEFPDRDHPVHEAAAAYKTQCAKMICELAAAAGASKPAKVANQLMPLLDGLIVCAHVQGRDAGALGAREAAEIILDHSIPR